MDPASETGSLDDGALLRLQGRQRHLQSLEALEVRVTPQMFSLLMAFLARGGLPHLHYLDVELFRHKGDEGIYHLAYALINNCPRLTLVDLLGWKGTDKPRAVMYAGLAQMVKSAGCEQRLKITM